MNEPNEPLYSVKKGKKYMTGHSYATAVGYSFSWANELVSARKMERGTADALASNSGGIVVKATLTPKL